MRTTPLLGTKLWFKPRGWGGWGWAPAAWEGWAAVAAFVGITVVGATRPGLFGVLTELAGVVGLVAACVLKGTPPGGRKLLAEYEETMARRAEALDRARRRAG